MPLEASIDTFINSQSSNYVHFVYQRKHKSTIYAFQAFSHLILLALTIIVGVRQPDITHSIRFISMALGLILAHSTAITIIAVFYDSHYRCPQGTHSSRALSILDSPCACIMANILGTMNLLNLSGSLTAFGYLILLKLHAINQIHVITYLLTLTYVMKGSLLFIVPRRTVTYMLQVLLFGLFFCYLCMTARGSFLLVILIGFLIMHHLLSGFFVRRFIKRPLQLVRDCQKIQLLSQSFITKTFTNLLPHQILDALVQDQEVRLQIHSNMYLLVIKIDIPYFRAKLHKHFVTNVCKSSGETCACLTDCYSNHLVASAVDQFISSIDMILLDDFPQLTKIYSNLDTIKVITGESFAQANHRQDNDTGSVQPKDYMKLLSTFALLVNKCAEVFNLRTDSVITFGDLAIGFMGPSNISNYDVFGTPVALAAKLHDKIRIANQNSSMRDSVYLSKQNSNEGTWSESSSSLDFIDEPNLMKDVKASYHSASISRSRTTRSTLSLSRDTHSSLSSSCLSSNISSHLSSQSAQDSSPVEVGPNKLFGKRFEAYSNAKKKQPVNTDLSFSPTKMPGQDTMASAIDRPSNVYFSVINMLSRPIEEYGRRGNEGSDTITSDIALSDFYSDEPRILTNSDLDSSMNFRCFLNAKGSHRVAVYSKRQSIIKAFNSTASTDDDIFPQQLLLRNHHTDSNSSMGRRHRIQARSPGGHQVLQHGHVIPSSSSTNSIKAWSPQNLKIDKIYVDNALSQTALTYRNSGEGPSFHDVCNASIDITTLSLDGFSTLHFNIKYPSRITHKHRNFLFFKPPLYMFYDSIKVSMPSYSSSSSSMIGSSGTQSLSLLSFTNHNFSLIVCLLALGIKYRILFSEQNNDNLMTEIQQQDISSNLEAKDSFMSLLYKPKINYSINGPSISSLYETTSASDYTDKRTSSTSFIRSDPPPKLEGNDSNVFYQSLLQVEESILRSENPASSAYCALKILSSVPIYHSRAMCKLFRLLNTDLERFDKVITSLSRDFSHQNTSNLNHSLLLDNRLDFNFLVTNSGLVRPQKTLNANWSSVLKQVQMVVAKPATAASTPEMHTRNDNDFSQLSSFAHILSAEHTLLTSSESPSVSVVTPVHDTSIQEQHQPGQTLYNILSTSCLSDSRQGNQFVSHPQITATGGLAPENLPIPGIKSMPKLKRTDENLMTLVHLVSRKTDSFDSSTHNSDAMIARQGRRKRSHSYIPFSGNKLEMLYSNLGKLSSNVVSMDDIQMSWAPKSNDTGLATDFDSIKCAQILEFRKFKEFLDKNLNDKVDLTPDSKTESFSFSDYRDYRDYQSKPLFYTSTVEETEIPLSTTTPSIKQRSHKSDNTMTRGSVDSCKHDSNAPAGRSMLSYLCYSVSATSDTESKSIDEFVPEKNTSILQHSLITAEQIEYTSELVTDNSMHNLSLTQDSDTLDADSDAVKCIKFPTTNSSFYQDNAHSIVTVAEASTQLSSTISNPMKSTTHSHSMVLEGTSNLLTAMDSYSCLYKLEINEDNDETENSNHSVVLYNGSLPAQEDGVPDSLQIVPDVKRIGIGKGTMGGNPRPRQPSPAERPLQSPLDKGITSLSSTMCSDSLQEIGQVESCSTQNTTPSNSRHVFNISQSGADFSSNQNLWQTTSFLMPYKQNSATERSSLTTERNERIIETSFHVSENTQLETMVTSKAAPTPAYTPTSLLKINQYHNIVYATFGTAFNLVARPSVHRMSQASTQQLGTVPQASYDNFHTNHGQTNASNKNMQPSKTGCTDDSGSENEQNMNAAVSQETMIQMRERHNKFLNPKWRSTIYLKRCSLNAALSYIQLSDTSDYNCNTDFEYSDLQDSSSPGNISNTESDAPFKETDTTYNIFTNPRLKRLYRGDPSDHQESVNVLATSSKGMLSSILTLLRHPIRTLQKPVRQSPAIKEQLFLMTTFVPGYVVRTILDILLYLIFYVILFGEFVYSDNDQPSYILYLLGRVIIFSKWGQGKAYANVSETCFDASSVMDPEHSNQKAAVRYYTLFFNRAIHITTVRGAALRGSLPLLQRREGVRGFYALFGLLLILRVLFVSVRVAKSATRRDSNCARKFRLTHLFREHPLFHYFCLVIKGALNVIDHFSSLAVTFVKTFLLYEYFRVFQGFMLTNLVFLFITLITTYSTVVLELSPMCNTRASTILTFFVHVVANVMFIFDSRVFIESLLVFLKETKYYCRTLQHYLLLLLRETASTASVWSLIEPNSHPSLHYLHKQQQSIMSSISRELSPITNGSYCHKSRLLNQMYIFQRIHRIIQDGSQDSGPNIVAFLACAFSGRSISAPMAVRCESPADMQSLYQSIPHPRNICSALYLCTVLASILRVLFSQVSLHKTMLRCATQSIYAYVESKKLLTSIAHNRLDKIFFDCYLHTAFTACNSMIYQIERLFKSIWMDRDYKHVGKNLKLVGLTEDLMYDSQIKLPSEDHKISVYKLTDFGHLLKQRFLSLWHRKDEKATEGNKGEHELCEVLSHKTGEHCAHCECYANRSPQQRSMFAHRGASRRASVILNTTVSYPSFINMHECYDMHKSAERLFAKRMNEQCQMVQIICSNEKFHWIVNHTDFAQWKKYAIFRTCYGANNFTFRYLYDLETLKTILLYKFGMKVCDENMYLLKPDTVFEPYYSKTLAGILRALLTYKDCRFNQTPSPFLFIPSAYMLCLTVTELYEAIADEGAHITLLKYISFIKIVSDTVISDPNLLYIHQDNCMYIIYIGSQSSGLSDPSSIMNHYAGIFYLCKIAYTIRKLFLWDLEKRFFVQTFKVFGYINYHHELNVCMVGRRLQRLSVLDVSTLQDRIQSISISCGLFDVVIQEEIYKVIKEVYRTNANTNGMLDVRIDERGIYKKLLNIGESV